jgi:hypothetical protein
MKIENVDFNVEAITKMSEKEFIDAHLSTVNTHLPVETREKWLVMAYGKITGKKKISEKAVSERDAS